jgi:Raf kinase inhibitor-like YbhB/YbcL family protein
MISNTKTGLLRITSPAFTDNGNIPPKYTCEGDNINPPLNIAGIPPGTKSLAIIVEDPDATKGTFDHWVAWNIPVTTMIEEDSAPGTPGINGFKHLHYGGPCPPSGKHRYIFKVYALTKMVELPKGSNKESLQEEMEEYIIGYGELTGLYSKKQ